MSEFLTRKCMRCNCEYQIPSASKMEDIVFCPGCGEEIQARTGVPQDEEESEEEMPHKGCFVVFCIVLGSLMLIGLMSLCSKKDEKKKIKHQSSHRVHVPDYPYSGRAIIANDCFAFAEKADYELSFKMMKDREAFKSFFYRLALYGKATLLRSDDDVFVVDYTIMGSRYVQSDDGKRWWIPMECLQKK